MKFFSFIVTAAVLLSGCHSPIVETRNYSFTAKFSVNGKQYQLATNYTCHYENQNFNWMSEQGKTWHIRENHNIVRIIGSLEDGTRFEVLPRPKRITYNYCPKQTELIDVELFIEKSDSQVISFASSKNKSSLNNIEFIENKISLVGHSLDAFIQHHTWIEPSKRYYTVEAIIYDSSIWKNKPELGEFIQSKKIPWLERENTYPFLNWSRDNSDFAKLRSEIPEIDGYTDNAPRIPLIIGKNEEWVLQIGDQPAIQWLVEPVPSKEERNNSVYSEKFKRWVTFNDNRIEMPLPYHDRIFYQPEHDRLLDFIVKHVDLW